jgi:hypothetical protein
VRLGGDGGAVDPQQPRLGRAQEALERALGGELAGEFGALGGGELVGSGDRLLERVEQLLADRSVARGLLGLWQTTKRSRSVASSITTSLTRRLPATVW